MAKLRDRSEQAADQDAKGYHWRKVPLEELIGSEALAKWNELKNTKVDHSSLLAELDQIRGEVDPEAWEELPSDFIENMDHYMYGHPKQVTIVTDLR